MSGFKFVPSNTNLKYNFILSNTTYKFSIKEIPARHLSELYSLYLDKRFDILNNKLNKVYTCNVFFLSEDDCKLVLNCFRKLLILRNFFRKKLFHINHKLLELANETDLSYNTINLKDDNILTLINGKKYQYAFRISEIMNLYRYSLFNHDDEISEPISVKNPYTGEILTKQQHYSIYERILEYYCNKKKSFPEFYTVFKNSYFHIPLFYCKYYVRLNFNAINNYVNEMTFRQWIFSLTEHVSDQSFFCQKCFREKKDVRQIFSNIVQIFMLNDIDMFSYGTGLDKFTKLCKIHSLYFRKNHNHKSIKEGFNHRRGGRTLRPSALDLSQFILTPIPPLTPLNNLINSEENEENYRNIPTYLSEDENVIVNLSDNAEIIIKHTLLDIIDKIDIL